MGDRHAQAREALRAAEAQVRADSPQRGETDTGAAREGRDEPSGELAEALRFALRSTQNRPQTEAELAGKLRQRDHDEQTVEQALSAAREQGIVDDAAFAAAWVDDRGLRRGFGEIRLREELAARGVAEGDVEAALSRLEGRDHRGTAVELARSRARQLPGNVSHDAKVRRLGSYLLRRGHPTGLAERVAREVASETDGG